MKRYVKSGRFSNLSPIMAGTRYDKQAAEILTKSGLFDSETSTGIIDALFNHDIHAFVHSPNWLEKYLKGIARMIIEESDGDVSKAQAFIESCPDTFDKYLSYIKKLRDKLGGVSYDNKFINEMHFSDIENEIKEFNEQYYSDISNISKDSGISDYTLVRIDSYDDFNNLFGGHWTGDGKDENGEYAGHGGTSWCHANSRSTYNNWTQSGQQFFVLMANNFKDIPFDEESNAQNPKDAYGNSLIAIRVDSNGELQNATLRCNHVGIPKGEGADNQYQTFEQLSALAGFDIRPEIMESVLESRTKRYLAYNSKFGILKEVSDNYFGHLCHRIQALKDFDDVHMGDLGGYVESIDNLSEDGNCWINKYSHVTGSAIVKDNAKLMRWSSATDNSVVSGNAIICDSYISDNAIVSGNADIEQSTSVRGNANVSGNAELWHCGVDNDAEVYGNAKIEESQIFGNAKVYGDVKVKDSSYVYGSAKVYGNATISNSSICGNTEILGDAEISNSRIHRDEKIDYNIDGEVLY